MRVVDREIQLPVAWKLPIDVLDTQDTLTVEFALFLATLCNPSLPILAEQLREEMDHDEALNSHVLDLCTNLLDTLEENDPRRSLYNIVAIRQAATVAQESASADNYNTLSGHATLGTLDNVFTWLDTYLSAWIRAQRADRYVHHDDDDDAPSPPPPRRGGGDGGGERRRRRRGGGGGDRRRRGGGDRRRRGGTDRRRDDSDGDGDDDDDDDDDESGRRAVGRAAPTEQQEAAMLGVLRNQIGLREGQIQRLQEQLNNQSRALEDAERRAVPAERFRALIGRTHVQLRQLEEENERLRDENQILLARAGGTGESTLAEARMLDAGVRLVNRRVIDTWSNRHLNVFVDYLQRTLINPWTGAFHSRQQNRLITPPLQDNVGQTVLPLVMCAVPQDRLLTQIREMQAGGSRRVYGQ